ncbi:MAG TPA: matrixin family metalloprotease [Vicinamibacterales bacterium]
MSAPVSKMPRSLRMLGVCLVLCFAATRGIGAFDVSAGVKWSASPVPYYVNPTNLDLPTSVVPPAVQVGADAWSLQTNASFRFQYAGASSVTTNANDGVNVVMFRNASSGSAIATTYWWSSGSRIIDADIVFWDAGFTFFTGSTGCANGFYIEDIAAHEFGHALGLGHSTSTAATMYPSVSYCNTSNRSLDIDDINGVQTLYPPMPVPTAPTGVRIVPGL